MTKKDYILIAEAIHNSPVNEVTKEITTFTLAKSLHKDNKRFNFKQFYEACMGFPLRPPTLTLEVWSEGGEEKVRVVGQENVNVSS